MRREKPREGPALVIRKKPERRGGGRKGKPYHCSVQARSRKSRKENGRMKSSDLLEGAVLSPSGSRVKKEGGGRRIPN